MLLGEVAIILCGLQELKSPSCVRMISELQGAKVWVTDQTSKESGPFLFDFAYDDVKQETVFKDVGISLVDKVRSVAVPESASAWCSSCCSKWVRAGF